MKAVLLALGMLTFGSLYVPAEATPYHSPDEFQTSRLNRKFIPQCDEYQTVRLKKQVRRYQVASLDLAKRGGAGNSPCTRIAFFSENAMS